MAVEQSSTSTAADYNGLFCKYVSNQAQRLVHKIADIIGLIPAEMQAQALITSEYALQLPETVWPSARDLLLALAPKMEREGFRNDWTLLLEKGILHSQTLADLNGEAQLTLALGTLEQLQSQYEGANKHLQRCIVYFDILQDQRGKAKALNRLAFVARRLANYQQARDWSQDALTLLQCDDEERANSFYLLGAVAFDERNWLQAEQHYQQVLQIWQQACDTQRIAWGYSNLANALGRQQRYEEAIDYYGRAITLLEEVQDPINLATVHMNLGNIYLLLDQPDHALILFGQAEATFNKISDEVKLARIYLNQGIAYRKQEKWAYAEDVLHKSIALWQKFSNTRSHVNALDELGLIYVGKGQHERASDIYNEALSILNAMTISPDYQRLLQTLTTHADHAKKRETSGS